ncbi:MAG: tetratricopeptide repeat protein [Verrucomicrobiota bacterium]
MSAATLQAQLSPAEQRLAAVVREGDPARSIAAADALLQDSPQNVTALRVKAIALMEQEQLPSAIALLRQALKIDPDSVACRYYLAEALGTNGDITESVELLDEVKRRAPDSEYARRADVVLPELRPMAASLSPTYQSTSLGGMMQMTDNAAARFRFQARAALEYDDNVPLRGENSNLPGPQASGRAVLGWALDYSPWQQELDSLAVSLGFTYDGYRSWHERTALNNYDVNQNILGAYVERQGELATLPYRARLSGNWEYTEVGNEFFNHAEGFKVLFDLQWKPWTLTSFHYNYDHKDFSDNTSFPAAFSRDGSYHNIGLDQYFYLLNNKLILGVGYAYRWTETQGAQFNTNSHGVNVSAQVALPWKITWRSSAAYGSEDYTDYVPNPQRLDNFWIFSTALSRPICTDNMTVELSYTYSCADSSVTFAEYQRQVVGLGLRYRY